MSETKTGLQKHAALAVRLAALWLATGALFKLFAGSPKMIPEFVLEHSPVSWTLTYQIAIAIELAIVCIAILKPHRGWMLIAAIFAFFIALLLDMALKGKESCGCMGDNVKINPLVMLGIDSAFLGFVLVTKPWKSLSPPGLSTPLMLLGVLVSIALPFLVVRPEQPVMPLTVNGGTTVVDPGSTTTTPSRVYINMDPGKWSGKSIYDIEEFTRLVPMDKIPSDGRIVLWRQSCDHCAKHLRDLANEKGAPTPILLVQVMDDLKSGAAVDVKPSGGHVTEVQMPLGEGLFTTPVEIRVEGGVVTAVLYEEDFEKQNAK
ncbi:MAG: hypothetical protein SGI72_03610 [Planctomycetota bacterium]|nr:hypothetical protein [Planctomycetota bacterium]